MDLHVVNCSHHFPLLPLLFIIIPYNWSLISQPNLCFIMLQTQLHWCTLYSSNQSSPTVHAILLSHILYIVYLFLLILQKQSKEVHNRVKLTTTISQTKVSLHLLVFLFSFHIYHLQFTFHNSLKDLIIRAHLEITIITGWNACAAVVVVEE